MVQMVIMVEIVILGRDGTGRVTWTPLIIGSKLTFLGWSDRWLPYSALLKVTSTTIYIYIIMESSNYVQHAFCQSGSDSRWFLSKKNWKTLMELETPFPPPLHGNFHFVFWNPSLYIFNTFYIFDIFQGSLLHSLPRDRVWHVPGGLQVLGSSFATKTCWLSFLMITFINNDLPSLVTTTHSTFFTGAFLAPNIELSLNSVRTPW